ncbi:MAG: dihydrofolate reductase family protein, partial [Chloroflexi bacterium]|nr:dihydrofolate reductase family protein [Chloroflexota bacterium]
LRKESGKDIWLFGGGSLFRSLAQEGLVDTVEVAIVRRRNVCDACEEMFVTDFDALSVRRQTL